ncbi:DUF3093 domain-containing protein [Brachybacterium sp. EF45031]|uniref:DUF3093 domain-containing protein n=1 Tax=Brachybacterium sillae TaxID=2810536 RepID=UPI00217DB6B9|nr:DUF3093 domain-containing protein [Brachybacterium sillae]MCS6710513.1 DUF3093 domain-containing protein [Brachybacterium sillae]
MTDTARDRTASAVYRERLSPGAFALLVAAFFGASLGVLLVPLSAVAAGIVALLGAVLVPAALVATSPVVEVTDERWRVGRAQIDRGLLGAPQTLEGADWDLAMGPGFAPREFHCTRGWIRGGIRVPLEDPRDPHPAWVVSSRHPDRLARALSTEDDASTA